MSYEEKLRALAERPETRFWALRGEHEWMELLWHGEAPTKRCVTCYIQEDWILSPEAMQTAKEFKEAHPASSHLVDVARSVPYCLRTDLGSIVDTMDACHQAITRLFRHGGQRRWWCQLARDLTIFYGDTKEEAATNALYAAETSEVPA